MDSTLQQLGSLFVQAIPTILFFIFLAVFLNAVLFKPLGAILDARREATEGVRALADRARAAADQKASEFERALQLAEAEIHQEHEQLKRQWEEEQNAELAEARAQAEALLATSKSQIEVEARQAGADLALQVQALSERITNALLTRRAA